MAYSREKYEKIYRLILEDIPYRDIADRMNISKNTVSAVNKRKKETGSIYPTRTRLSKYDTHLKAITASIRYYMTLSRKTYKKHFNTKLSKDEIYTLTQAEGIELSKSKFNQLYCIEKKKQLESYLTIHYTPSEIVQFDWGYLTMNINGSNKRVYFGVFVFPYSLYQICFVTDREDSKHFNDIFLQFLTRVKGLADKLVIDNMRLAKKIQDPTIKDKQLTRFFQELSTYYQFDVSFCANYCPNQKGNVEVGVKFVKNIIKNCYISEFKSLSHVQILIDNNLEIMNNKFHPTKNNTRIALFNEEKALMLPLPSRPFVYYHYKTRKVNNKTLFISLNKSKYLVPEGHQGEHVIVRYNDQHIYIISEFDDIIAKYNYSHKKTPYIIVYGIYLIVFA